MNWDKIWDLFVHTMMVIFMPIVCLYYSLSASVFLNVSVQNATGLERISNELLIPVHYLLAGKEAIKKLDGSWELTQRFDYKEWFWLKTTACVIALPPSLILGSLAKGLSLMGKPTRERFATLRSLPFTSNLDAYRSWGLAIDPSPEVFFSQGHQRRPGDEQVLQVEKQALQEIAQLLNQMNIPWWLDCGSCLGAYRYGGVIPWDEDIDIAVLLPDFNNLLHLLHQLDPKKYLIQDWSTRDHPNSFIKVYIRESGTMIDVYHFEIDKKEKQLRFVFALETNIFFPEWFKIRERRFKEPVAFDTVFPLKRAFLDGIEVFMPNDPKKYLQRCYGDNLDPVKIYNPITDSYEKDVNHPYWQRAYVH